MKFELVKFKESLAVKNPPSTTHMSTRPKANWVSARTAEMVSWTAKMIAIAEKVPGTGRPSKMVSINKFMRKWSLLISCLACGRRENGLYIKEVCRKLLYFLSISYFRPDIRDVCVS